MKKISSYNLGADVIRVLSVICVVIIHTANAIYARPDYFGGLSWWIALLLGAFSRIAIPLFVMLSGYLLLQKDESLPKSLVRAGQRILIPLIFWVLFYIWWGNGNPAVPSFDLSLLARFFTINVGHLYFLYIVLGLYIAAPFLRSYIQKSSEKEQKNLVIFFLLLGMIQIGAQYLFSRCSASDAFTFWIPYIGFFIGGVILPTTKFIKQKASLVALYMVGLLATIGFEYYFYAEKLQGVNLFNPPGCISFYFDYYVSVNVVLMSVALFMLLIHMDFSFIKNTFVKQAIYSIARASFGIFILHIFFLSIIDGKIPQIAHLTPLWLALLVRIGLVFTISYSATIVLTKIPYLKMLFGEK